MYFSTYYMFRVVFFLFMFICCLALPRFAVCLCSDATFTRIFHISDVSSMLLHCKHIIKCLKQTHAFLQLINHLICAEFWYVFHLGFSAILVKYFINFIFRYSKTFSYADKFSEFFNVVAFEKSMFVATTVVIIGTGNFIE